MKDLKKPGNLISLSREGEYISHKQKSQHACQLENRGNLFSCHLNSKLFPFRIPKFPTIVPAVKLFLRSRIDVSFKKSAIETFQSILRGKGISQRSQRKKNVTFTDDLTEIIGYGGDDFFSEDEEEEDEQDTAESLNGDDEIPPDSEEERALGNLTRANTNFNTITANLTEIVATNESSKSSSKSFASLMLGRIQKDSEGKKTTLLVSVTPFGGDESLPTAKRPGDKKVNGFVNGFTNFSKCKSTTTTTTVDNEKAEVG